MNNYLNKLHKNSIDEGFKATSIKIKNFFLRRTLPYLDPWRWPNIIDYHFNPNAIRESNLPHDSLVVREQLENAGIPVESYHINIESFHKWLDKASFPKQYSDSYGSLFIEKVLEHYLSAELLEFNAQDIFIDVAAGNSPWFEIAKNVYGCTAYALDLTFPKGINGKKIGADATAMPFSNYSVTKIALHCAFEMFEGNADGLFIKEAARVLKPGGRMIIIPLYLSEVYHILRDPKSSTHGLKIKDKDARIVYSPNFGHNFARVYSVDALQWRVLNHLSNMSIRILFVENEKEVDPNCYLKFIAVFDIIKK